MSSSAKNLFVDNRKPKALLLVLVFGSNSNSNSNSMSLVYGHQIVISCSAFSSLSRSPMDKSINPLNLSLGIPKH